ncbi:hypothetical protein D3C81_1936580 [compost metagenome]
MNFALSAMADRPLTWSSAEMTGDWARRRRSALSSQAAFSEARSPRTASSAPVSCERSNSA